MNMLAHSVYSVSTLKGTVRSEMLNQISHRYSILSLIMKKTENVSDFLVVISEYIFLGRK